MLLWSFIIFPLGNVPQLFWCWDETSIRACNKQGVLTLGICACCWIQKLCSVSLSSACRRAWSWYSHSYPGGFSGNRAERKEAEVCFFTVRAQEGDFHDKPVEKGPLRKYELSDKVFLNHQQWPCLCYKLGVEDIDKSISQMAIAKASAGKMKSLLFLCGQGCSTCTC